jgi:hypothetical protein
MHAKRARRSSAAGVSPKRKEYAYVRRLNPALVVSVAALVLALTGTAVAGGYIITSTRQIKPSVRKALKGKRGPRGWAGLDGAPGVPGTPGAQGPVGMANIVIAEGDSTLCAGAVDCSLGSAEAVCPPGTKPFGGGVATGALNGTFVGSISTSNGYYVAADNWGASSTADLTAFAYCSADVKSIQFPDGTVSRSKLDKLAAARLATHKR